MDSLIMQHSPKAGVFNKLKKKLSKGRRYEIGSAGDDTDIKLQKFEAMYARFPGQGDGGPKSRDSSPSIMDMESPKRSVLDSPQRANLSEKDINKTNTYTKDPTKEQKKNGSPTKEVKNQKGAGPIIFINNTYDLPPILPVKKGAISDKRQRSKERHKDQVSNKDGKKGDTDKQAVRNDKGEENKENSKVGTKSPHKSKSRGGSAAGLSRGEAGAKVGLASEDLISSGSNSSGSSGDGKFKSRDPEKSKKDEEQLIDLVDSAPKAAVKSGQTGDSTNSPNANLDNRSPKIIPLFADKKSIWGSEKGSRNCSIEELGNKQHLDDSAVNGEIDTEKNRDALVSDKGTANQACHANDVGDQKNSPCNKKANVQQQGNISNGAAAELVPRLKCESPATKQNPDSGNKKDSQQNSKGKQGHKSPAVSNAKGNKSDACIAEKNGSDGSIITERGKGNSVENGIKTKADTSHAKLHDVPLFRPLRVDKIPVKKEAEVAGVIKGQSNSTQKLDTQSDEDSEDDMELGYTSLADVEKIFGSKKETANSQAVAAKARVTKGGLLHKQSVFARDGNGNVMRGPGCVIKCDVNVQGCNVRPLLVDRLTSAQFQGHPRDTDTKAIGPATEAYKIDPEEESEYGSIGDYSSRNVCSKVKLITNNSNMGARPKQKTAAARNSTTTITNKDSPVVKVTKEMSKLPGFTGSSSPEIQQHFDLNLNLEVERGISHESGYETGGSGLRSHSSSSNEFIQHDSSSYSLVSEPGEESSSVPNSTPPVNLNDSTSSEEPHETKRVRPVSDDSSEHPESQALLANLYAFVPKGSQRSADASNVDCDIGDSENSGGSSEKTECQNRSTIQSPDSMKLEDTLIDDYDSEPYDDVDYGFEDGEEEDDDYLPPIPTRNYASEEQRLLEIKQSVETNSKCKPPMMTVIGSKKSMEEADQEASPVAQAQPAEEIKQENGVLDLSVKKIAKPVSTIPEKTIENGLSTAAAKSNPIPILGKTKTADAVSTAAVPRSKPLPAAKPTKTVPEMTQNSIEVKTDIIRAKSPAMCKDDSNKGTSAAKPREKSKSESDQASSSKNNCTTRLMMATLKTTQADVHRHASYSPVRRKSYEKVERSTPLKETDIQAEGNPTSPVRSAREGRSSGGPQAGRHRKDSENSKDAKENKADKGVDIVEATPQKEKKHSNSSSISLDSSKSSKDDLRKSILDIKPEKLGDSPSKIDELYNQSFSSDSTLSLDQPFWASFEEPVHMSMEEVLNQAKDLGIPLALPSGSPTKDSSTESICSPNHRYSAQTLPCPRHGVITQDKLPKKKPGTLKDKFASLFTRKSGSSTSPKHNEPGGSESIQRRSLPPPPSSNDLDTVDGSTSPRKRSRNSKSVCEIHGGDISRTLSPSHRFSPTQQAEGSSCCCQCSESSDGATGHRYNKHKGSSSSGNSNCHQHHSSHRNPCVHECSCHSSPCKNTKCQGGHCCKGHEVDEVSSDRHQQHRHHALCTYPRHHSSSRHGNQVSPDKQHPSSTQQHHHRRRERSQSREVMMRSRSPHHHNTIHSLPSSKKSSSGSPHQQPLHQQQAYLGGTQPRQSRSSSSTGISQRCPPSPAPSGTSSVLSAPSAFNFPQRIASPSHVTHDLSPTRSACSQSNPSINGNADFIASLSKLKDVGWYWGPLSWDDAEAKLGNKPDGAFLVRDSSDDRYILSLSFRSQGTTHHTRIEHYKGMFSFYSQPKSHGAATIIEFIDKAMDHSRSGKFLYFLRPRAPGLPPAPVQLLFPVSRFQTMQTLQHLCRFSILKHVRRDHIDQLPVPQRIKDYLEMSQYYIEYLGEDMGFRQ